MSGEFPLSVAEPHSVFIVDDSLSEIQKCKRYTLSQLPLQRLVYVKRLTSCARGAGMADTAAHLLPLLSKVVQDKESVVRQALGQECGALACYLAFPTYNPEDSATAAAMPSLDGKSVVRDPPPWSRPSDTNSNLTFPLASSSPPASGAGTAAAGTAAAAAVAALPQLSLGQQVLSNGAASASTSGSKPPAMTDAANQVPISPSSAQSMAQHHVAAASALHPPHASSSHATVITLPTGGDRDAKSTDTKSDSASASGDTKNNSSASASASTSGSAPQSTAASSSSSSSSSGTSSPASGPVKLERTEFHPLLPVSQKEKEKDAAAAAAAAAAAQDAADAKIKAEIRAQQEKEKKEHETREKLKAERNANAKYPRSAAGMLHIRDSILPILNKLIVDPSAEVRTSSSEALVRVAHLMDDEEIGRIILTLVLCLAHDESDEQRTTAVGILHELAPLLGKELIKNFVCHEMVAFADDPIFRVRKAAAQNFGNVCATAGPEVTIAKLLPAFVKLSNDAIWGVRKGCVESLVAVAKVIPSDDRARVFIPMFERFTKDASRWVRNATFEVLGPFLHVLGTKLVSKEMLRHYTTIPELSNTVVDQEVTFFCAFNLPAVALTLGPDRWEELVECFDRLIKDTKFHVRRTLACSLHELAAILKDRPALTEKYVVPALDLFLKDLDEVKVGVIKNLAKILKFVPNTKRETYLETLWDVHNQSENWRWRQLLAEQMEEFSTLFSPELTGGTILQMTLSLCRDNVAAVRVVAVKGVGAILHRLHSTGSKKGYNDAVAKVLVFHTAKSYVERQLFIRMCQFMVGVLSQELFEADFFGPLTTLGSDRVPNVRLTLSQFVASLSTHPYFSKKVGKLLAGLTSDKDRDVKQFSQVRGASAIAAAANGLDQKSAAMTDSDAQKELDEIMGHTASSNSSSVATTPTAAAASATAAVGADNKHIDTPRNSQPTTPMGGASTSAAAAAVAATAATAATSSPAKDTAAAATATPVTPAAAELDPAAAAAAAAAALAAAEAIKAKKANGGAPVADDAKHAEYVQSPLGVRRKSVDVNPVDVGAVAVDEIEMDMYADQNKSSATASATATAAAAASTAAPMSDAAEDSKSDKKSGDAAKPSLSKTKSNEPEKALTKDIDKELTELEVKKQHEIERDIIMHETAAPTGFFESAFELEKKKKKKASKSNPTSPAASPPVSPTKDAAPSAAAAAAAAATASPSTPAAAADATANGDSTSSSPSAPAS